MIGAQDRAEVAHAFRALRSMQILVEVVAEQVDAIRPGQVVEHVAVEIGDRHAGRRFQERSGGQMSPDDAAELERHAIGAVNCRSEMLGRGLRRHARWSWRSVRARDRIIA